MYALFIKSAPTYPAIKLNKAGKEFAIGNTKEPITKPATARINHFTAEGNRFVPLYAIACNNVQNSAPSKAGRYALTKIFIL